MAAYQPCRHLYRKNDGEATGPRIRDEARTHAERTLPGFVGCGKNHPGPWTEDGPLGRQVEEQPSKETDGVSCGRPGGKRSGRTLPMDSRGACGGHIGLSPAAHPSGSSMSCWSRAACSGTSLGSHEASMRPRDTRSRRWIWSLRRYEFSFIRTSASSVTTA